jgi:hypothetical protein
MGLSLPDYLAFHKQWLNADHLRGSIMKGRWVSVDTFFLDQELGVYNIGATVFSRWHSSLRCQNLVPEIHVKSILPEAFYRSTIMEGSLFSIPTLDIGVKELGQ